MVEQRSVHHVSMQNVANPGGECDEDDTVAVSEVHSRQAMAQGVYIICKYIYEIN